MLYYVESYDEHGNRRLVVQVFGRTIYEKGSVDLNHIAYISGFELNWTHLSLLNGVDNNRLPKIEVIELGSRIAGKRGMHEDEIANKRRSVTQLGESYEIREYNRLEYRKRLYKWFGMVSETKHVYKVIGKDCPEFTFAGETWGTQRPSDFEIINQAKQVKRLVESIRGNDHE